MKLQRKDYIYVGLQLLLFMAYIFEIELVYIDNFRYVDVIGIILIISGVLTSLIALLQLNTNLSPFPTPKSNTELITTGIYKYVRHPIYTGIFLITFGYGFFTVSLYKIIISLLLYVLFYFKSSYEENRLDKVFSNYVLYRKKSGRFFPKI